MSVFLERNFRLVDGGLWANNPLNSWRRSMPIIDWASSLKISACSPLAPGKARRSTSQQRKVERPTGLQLARMGIRNSMGGQ